VPGRAWGGKSWWKTAKNRQGMPIPAANFLDEPAIGG
jgi:hypothetical protein